MIRRSIAAAVLALVPLATASPASALCVGPEESFHICVFESAPGAP